MRVCVCIMLRRKSVCITQCTFPHNASTVLTRQQGRMSWMLLTLYNNVQQQQDWLTWAESGLKFVFDIKLPPNLQSG